MARYEMMLAGCRPEVFFGKEFRRVAHAIHLLRM